MADPFEMSFWTGLLIQKVHKSHKLTSGGERSVWMVLSSTWSTIESVDGTFNRKSKYTKCRGEVLHTHSQKLLTPLVKFVPLDA